MIKQMPPYPYLFENCAIDYLLKIVPLCDIPLGREKLKINQKLTHKASLFARLN